jgi:hypothetical protein
MTDLDAYVIGPHWEEDIETLSEDEIALLEALEVDPEEIQRMKGE